MTLAFAPERIETWPLARLQPYAKNAKLHGADQVARLAASTPSPVLRASAGRVSWLVRSTRV